jgi:hypothetical protein
VAACKRQQQQQQDQMADTQAEALEAPHGTGQQQEVKTALQNTAQHSTAQ